MPMLREKVARLLRFYEKLDKAKGRDYSYVKGTEVGEFAISCLVEVDQALDELVRDGVIDPSKPFLDAGCGDARVVALANVYGFPSYGVEGDLKFLREGESNLSRLRRKGILTRGVPAVVFHGKFSVDSTYEGAGLRFSDFSTIFNYISNVETIATKIARDSPPGTVFILYGSELEAPPFDGLRIERSLTLLDTSRKDPKDVLCHVYVKELRI